MQVENKLNLALQEALMRDFPEIEKFEKTPYEHQFSVEFEENMQRIFKMAEKEYVSIRHHRLRKAFVVALIATLLMTTVGGAVAISKPLVKWITEQNEKLNVLDITFEVDGENEPIEDSIAYIQPKTPKGYKIVREDKYGIGYDIEYENNQGQVIYYSQMGAIEPMGLSLDNEDDSLHETTINGYAGYVWEKSGNCALTWSDGRYLFDLSGTCSLETLEHMAKSIY